MSAIDSAPGMERDAAALEHYMALPYRVELIPDPDDGGYVVSIPDLPGCLSEGDTAAEAMEMIRDAQRGWIAVALAHGDPIPAPRPVEEYSGRFNVRVPRSLHRELVRAAERDGVSLNAYVTAALIQVISSASVGEATALGELRDEIHAIATWVRKKQEAEDEAQARAIVKKELGRQ